MDGLGEMNLGPGALEPCKILLFGSPWLYVKKLQVNDIIELMIYDVENEAE